MTPVTAAAASPRAILSPRPRSVHVWRPLVLFKKSQVQTQSGGGGRGGDSGRSESRTHLWL